MKENNYLILSTPLSKDFCQIFVNNISDLELKCERVNLFIDLQNIFIGRYYELNTFNIYTEVQEEDFVKICIDRLLDLVCSKIELLKSYNLKCVVYLYTDVERNIVNESLIPGWKSKRVKSTEYMTSTELAYLESSRWVNRMFKGSVISLSKLLNCSKRCRVMILKYLDSDFLPYYVILSQKRYFLKEKMDYPFVNLIVSTDRDYIHMVQEDDRNMMYIFYPHHKRTVLNKYSAYQYCTLFTSKRFGSDEYKNIAKCYPLFHCLVGDVGDSVGRLIKRSVYQIYKDLEDFIKENDIDTLRDSIFETRVIRDYLGEDKFEEFIRRYVVLDFYFFSVYLLSLSNPEMLTDVDRIRLDRVKRYLLQYQDHFNSNSETLKQINMSDKISAEDATRVLRQVGIERASYYSALLFS